MCCPSVKCLPALSHYVWSDDNPPIVSYSGKNFKFSQFPSVFQIVVDDKDSILASIPEERKEKGFLVHESLINGKVFKKNTLGL